MNVHDNEILDFISHKIGYHDSIDDQLTTNWPDMQDNLPKKVADRTYFIDVDNETVAEGTLAEVKKLLSVFPGGVIRYYAPTMAEISAQQAENREQRRYERSGTYIRK